MSNGEPQDLIALLRGMARHEHKWGAVRRARERVRRGRPAHGWLAGLI